MPTGSTPSKNYERNFKARLNNPESENDTERERVRLLRLSLDQTQKTMDRLTQLNVRIDQAIEIKNQYGISLNNKIDYFNIFYPYHELFADAFSVLVMEDWSILKTSQIHHFKNKNLHEIMSILPQGTKSKDSQKAFETLLNCRDFGTEFWSDEAMKNYELELNSIYCHFLPIRPLIRHHLTESQLDSASKIATLALATIDVYENEITSLSENTHWSLYEINQGFLQVFLKYIKTLEE